MRLPVLVVSLLTASAALAAAPSPSHLEGYGADPGEPMAPAASIAKASHFLETWSLKWTRQNKCGSCHTNLAHVMAQPFLVERTAAAEKEIRDGLFDFLASYNPNVNDVPPDQRRANNNILWNRLVIASIFAIADGEAKVPQDPRTLARFDQIWDMQNADGTFDYPRKALPFLEDDKYYVMTMVSIAASYLPADHLKKPAAAEGLKRLNRYLASTPPKDQHDELVLMRAGLAAPELMTPAHKEDLVKRTLALQHADGGWGVASLGSWPRRDGGVTAKDRPSDGYGTGFVLYTLCKTGTPANDPAVQKGLAWLKTHQRESGRWFTQSLWADDYQNYVSTIGTAYAVMALRQCGG